MSTQQQVQQQVQQHAQQPLREQTAPVSRTVLAPQPPRAAYAAPTSPTVAPPAAFAGGAAAGSARPVAMALAPSIPRNTRAVYTVPAAAVASRVNGSSMLTSAGSASVLHDVNSRRTTLTGINQRPIPPGLVTARQDGSLMVNTKDGRQFGVRPNGTLASFTSRERTAAFHSNGQIRTVHTPSMDITRNVRGQRTVILRRPDNSVLVSTGPSSGYLQRTITRGGTQLIQRSYVMGNVHYTRVYNTYRYHGMTLASYVPVYRYPPAFYDWAAQSWGAPAPYRWAFTESPWYAQYGAYFAVSPAYAGPAFWLTDFFLALTLAESYQADSQALQPAGAAAPGEENAADELQAPQTTPISPQIKDALAAQVQQQIAMDSQGPTGLDKVLIPNHLFVASTPLMLTTGDGATCAVAGGDVLQLAAVPGEDAAEASLIVASSRESDCPVGVQVSVSLADLQDMQNGLRAKLDSGMKALRGAQGQGGLPAAPPAAAVPPTAEAPPPDDPSVQTELTAAQQQAAEAETQVSQAATLPSLI